MDSNILEILYKKYYNAAYLYTLSLCNNKALSEDIVSDAFVKAFLSLKKDNGSFKYWLLVVCKNLYIDYLRKEKKRSLFTFEEMEAAAVDEAIDEIILNSERNRLIYKAIMSLDIKYREILVLYYYSSMTLTEIATLLKITKENTKVILHRARKKLKISLEEEGYEF